MCFLKRPRKPTTSSQSTQKWREEDYRDLENYLALIPRHFHSHTFQPKIAKDVCGFLCSSRNLSQIFWLRICEPSSPEAWKASLMSVTMNTGWSSRAVEDVALQVVSYSFQLLTVVLWMEIMLYMLTTGIQELVRGLSSKISCSWPCNPPKNLHWAK